MTSPGTGDWAQGSQPHAASASTGSVTILWQPVMSCRSILLAMERVCGPPESRAHADGTVSANRFHLQARCLAGPLNALTRNETCTRQSDDWDELERLAHHLNADGFTVWISRTRRGHGLGTATASACAAGPFTPRVHVDQERDRHRQDLTPGTEVAP